MQFIDSHPWVMQLVGPTVLLISVCLVFRQLRANLRANRRSQYLTAFEFSEKYFENAIFHWRDHFEEATYTSLYSGNKDRCRSYLLMMRKYMYLLYQHRFQDEISAGCERWMWELAAYQEFRDAHKSTGRYYPAFSKKVNKAIELTALKGWYYLEPDSPVNVPS